jgi:hypothetical protein
MGSSRVILLLMPTRKVSVTLEADSIARARRSAGPRGLSSYLDTALAEKLERDEKRTALLTYLDDLERSDPTPVATKQRAHKRAERIRAVVTR